MTNDPFSSEDYVKNLVDNVTDNCKNVEELALGEINARHIPLINSTLCLTNEDCKIILDQCQQHCHNVLEKSVLLIALTDFISCVSANSETFPLESKKNEKRRIELLMQTLQNSWSKLFAKLTAEDISISQMTGIATIVKRCLERIPSHRTYKMYLEIILKMTDKVSHILLKPSEVENIHLNPGIQPSRDVAPPNCGTFTKAHKSPELVFQLPVNRHVKQKKENKGKVKQPYDITKFILKPCENVIRDETNENAENSQGCKRKFQEIESGQAGIGDEQIEKDSVVHLEEIETPPPKKHCVHDEFINGKLNAFKMLMKPRKAKSQMRQLNENSLSS